MAKNPLLGLWTRRNTPSFPRPYPQWLIRHQFRVKREN